MKYKVSQTCYLLKTNFIKCENLCQGLVLGNNKHATHHKLPKQSNPNESKIEDNFSIE